MDQSVLSRAMLEIECGKCRSEAPLTWVELPDGSWYRERHEIEPRCCPEHVQHVEKLVADGEWPKQGDDDGGVVSVGYRVSGQEQSQSRLFKIPS